MARRGDALAIAGLALIAGSALPAALQAQGRRAGQTKCSNNLRQLGLAAIQYADDKRFYPHFSAIRSVDPGYDSSTSTRAARLLLWHAYFDAPATMICPDSTDRARPWSAEDASAGKRWFWGQQHGSEPANRSPIEATAQDPKLPDTAELSYGWVRRGYNSNVRSTRALAADRRLEHHGDGWSTLYADGTVNWLPGGDESRALLTGEEAEQHALAVQARGERDPVVGAARAPAEEPRGNPLVRRRWVGAFASADDSVALAIREGEGGLEARMIVDGETYTPAVKVEGESLTGHFEAGGVDYPFSARFDGEVLVLTSGASTHRLTRRNR